MQEFDPYHRWLGIPPHEQPPTLYRLLGISDFESDQEVITEASYRQLGHIKQYASGPHRDAANKILNELSQAQVTLLDLKKKTQYDISIQSTDEEGDDSVAGEEATVDLDVSVVVGGTGSVRGGSFKGNAGGKRRIKRKRKRSKVPVFLFVVGVLAFVGGTFAYWWSRQNNGQPNDPVANKTDVSDPAVTPRSGGAPSGDSVKSEKSVKPIGNKDTVETGNGASVSPQATSNGEARRPDEHSEVGNAQSIGSKGALANDFVPAIGDNVEPDDLTALNDVGRTAQKTLYANGVKTYKQISQLSPGTLDRLLRKGEGPKKGRQRCAKVIAEAKAMVERAAAGQLADAQGHTGPVTSVAFSKGGKLVASASDDMTVKLWDGMGDQKLLRTFNGHESNVKSVAFSPGGNRIVTGSWDKTLILWSAGTGNKIRTFIGHSAPVWSVAFSPTGQQIVSGGEDGIKLWDAATGRELRSFGGHSDTVTSVAFSPNGREIVSGSFDHTVKVWDAVSGRELRTLSGHTEKVTSVAFSPQGSQVISGSWDKTLILWEADSGKQLQTFSGHTKAVLTVAFSGAGKRVASGGGDKRLLVWDVGTGQKLGAFDGHTDYVTSVAFSPDGQRVVSGANDQSVQTWEAAGLKPVVVATVDDAKEPTFFEDKKTLTRKQAGSVKQDSNKTNSTKPANGSSVVTLEGHTGAVESVAVSSRGRWIVSASADGTLILWDVKKGEQKRVFEELVSQSRTVVFSPDDRSVICGTDSGDIELWSVSNGRKEQTLSEHKSAVYSVACSRNGKQIVSCDSSGQVKIWLAAERKVETLAVGFERAAFSSDGELIVIGGRSGKLEVRSARKGEKLQTYRGRSSEILSVAFSDDRKKIVCGCDDNTVKVWDVVSGAELKAFSGHTGAVNAVAFSPDGDWIASGSADGSIKIWDVDTGEELHTFSDHERDVTGLAFLPKGKRLVSGSLDKTVKIWSLEEVGRK